MVSILCNHQRSVPKGFAASFEKLKQKLTLKKRQLKGLRKHLKLVREGKVKEEVLVRLEEVSKANRPDAFRWDLMPPSLVSTNRTNKMFDTNEDVSMTNMLRSTVSKRREDLETGTSSRRKSSVLFEEQVSLSEGLRRRTPMSSKDKIRRRTVIDTYRPPSFTTARAYVFWFFFYVVLKTVLKTSNTHFMSSGTGKNVCHTTPN